MLESGLRILQQPQQHAAGGRMARTRMRKHHASYHLLLALLLLALALYQAVAATGYHFPVDPAALSDDSTGWVPQQHGEQQQEEQEEEEEREEASSSSSFLPLSSSSWLDSTSSSIPPQTAEEEGAAAAAAATDDGSERSGQRRSRRGAARREAAAAAEEDEEEDEEASLEALLSAPALEDRKAESPWVARFCSAPAHGRFYCRVPASFIGEEFNWLDLACPPDLEAIDRLLLARPQPGPAPPTVDNPGGFANAHAGGSEALQAAARRMYGMIHARYIVTQKGLNAMREKFEAAHFGTCPRMGCGDQAVLPLGLREEPRREGSRDDDEHGLKLFCPRCRELYRPDGDAAGLDGAYWGTSFAHLFLLAFPELDPGRTAPPPPVEAAGGDASKRKGPAYVPRVFGFRVGSPRSIPSLAPEPEAAGAKEQEAEKEIVMDAEPPVPSPKASAPDVQDSSPTAPPKEQETRGQIRSRRPVEPGAALSFLFISGPRRRSPEAPARASVEDGRWWRRLSSALKARLAQSWLHRAVQRIR